MQQTLILTIEQQAAVLRAVNAGVGRTLPAVLAIAIRQQLTAGEHLDGDTPRVRVTMSAELWAAVAAELQGHMNAGTTDRQLGIGYYDVQELREDLLAPPYGYALAGQA